MSRRIPDADSGVRTRGCRIGSIARSILPAGKPRGFYCQPFSRRGPYVKGTVYHASPACRGAHVYGDENAGSHNNLAISYRLENTDYALQHLTCVPDSQLGLPFDEPDDDSYFPLWVTPPAKITQTRILPKPASPEKPEARSQPELPANQWVTFPEFAAFFRRSYTGRL